MGQPLPWVMGRGGEGAPETGSPLAHPWTRTDVGDGWARGLGDGVGVGRCVAERRQWSLESPEEAGSLARPPPPPASSYPHPFSVRSTQGFLLSPLLSEAAHPGLRAGAARLQLSPEGERAFLPLGFLYPGLHFPVLLPENRLFRFLGINAASLWRCQR